MRQGKEGGFGVPESALRVALVLRDGEWTIGQPLEVPPTILPGSTHEPGAGAPRGGAWFDVVDARGLVVYRRAIPGLDHAVVEGRQEGERIVRVVAPARQTFSLLVPRPPAGGRIDVHGPADVLASRPLPGAKGGVA